MTYRLQDGKPHIFTPFHDSNIGKGMYVPQRIMKAFIVEDKEMSDETVNLKKDDLLKAHAEGCPDVRAALEKLYPEIFGHQMEHGQVYIKNDGKEVDPYIAVSDSRQKYRLVALDGNKGYGDFHPPEYYADKVRLMRDGVLTLFVKDSKITKCFISDGKSKPLEK